jgi:hypothetical protein
MTKKNIMPMLILSCVIASGFGQSSIGIEINTRGFYSAGLSYQYALDEAFTIGATMEIPLGFAADRGLDKAGRLSVFSRYNGAESSLYWEVLPEISFLWLEQELGNFVTLMLGADVELGYDFGEAKLGFLTGLEYNPLMFFDPGAFVQSTFEGSGQAAPPAGWYANSGLNWRVGLTTAWELGDHFDLGFNAGLRLQPVTDAPLFSGFPYGNLPFFSELSCVYSLD